MPPSKLLRLVLKQHIVSCDLSANRFSTHSTHPGLALREKRSPRGVQKHNFPQIWLASVAGRVAEPSQAGQSTSLVPSEILPGVFSLARHSPCLSSFSLFT